MKFIQASLAIVAAKFSKTVISTPDAPGAIGPYSQGIMSTNDNGDAILYAAGQIGLVPSTGVLAEGGITGETKQLMENIKAIMTAGGATMADILECNCLLADLGEYDAFNQVYGSYFDADEAPARAAFQVAELPKGARAEVKCTAHFNVAAKPTTYTSFIDDSGMFRGGFMQ